MNISDFDFFLPKDLIALRPARPRMSSRLLVSQKNAIKHDYFNNLGRYLRPKDRLIINNSKVIPARLRAKRRRVSRQSESFANVEMTLLSLDAQTRWLAFCKPARRVKVGEVLYVAPDFFATVLEKTNQGLKIQFNVRGDDFTKKLSNYGIMPLPPYISNQRPADSHDMVDYQSVFAKVSGAVAAPTASLHFTHEMLSDLRRCDIQLSEVTLHVGLGTFLPITSVDINAHKMHAEWGEISQQTAAEIKCTQQGGGRIIAVGTTVLRLLETAFQDGCVRPWVGKTDIFIKPGFKFQAIDALITNFHLPKSTLLMLVATLIGLDRTHIVYKQAINHRYRFFSYGDASFLLP